MFYILFSMTAAVHPGFRFWYDREGFSPGQKHDLDLRAFNDFDIALPVRTPAPELDTVNEAGLGSFPGTVDLRTHFKGIVAELIFCIPAHTVAKDNERSEMAVKCGKVRGRIVFGEIKKMAMRVRMHTGLGILSDKKFSVLLQAM